MPAAGPISDPSGYPLHSVESPSVITARLVSYDFYYDFAVDGGTISSIPLRGPNPLPAGFVINEVFKEIVTALTSAANTATAALTTGEAANDLFTATVVSNAMWTTLTTVMAQITKKTTAQRTPNLVIAVQNLTAGKFTLHVNGHMAPAA